MPHFGIICPPLPGHLNPLCALGRSLMRRGHRTTVFGVSDLAAKIGAEGLEFAALGADEFRDGDLSRSVEQMKKLHGFAATRFAVQSACRMARLILDYAPAALLESRIDGLLVDQNEPAGATAAERIQIPFISVCTSLPLNREADIPPPFTAWGYGRTPFGRLRNQVGYRVADYLIRELQATLNKYRKQWGLAPLRSPNDSFSTLAEIAQMPQEFDYPRAALPANFHYTGAWFDDHAPTDGFPFERLDGRPIVYGSLGTLQSSNSKHFRAMAEACSGLDLQAVITVGGKDETAVPVLPGNPLVVHWAPQIELLKRAALTITHAGMNTTMQSLSFGVPLVASPLAHDQAAIAARLQRSGAGIVIAPGKLTVERLRAAIVSILGEASPVRAQAKRMRNANERAGGVERAADIVEERILKPQARRARA